ncbi:hypothetical protein FACS1894182_02400 [Bacteroidia bacterium]|nr:hypothetical protein FACS1894182_02400 [Bacteroidia bacterium]
MCSQTETEFIITKISNTDNTVNIIVARSCDNAPIIIETSRTSAQATIKEVICLVKGLIYFLILLGILLYVIFIIFFTQIGQVNMAIIIRIYTNLL